MEEFIVGAICGLCFLSTNHFNDGYEEILLEEENQFHGTIL